MYRPSYRLLTRSLFTFRYRHATFRLVVIVIVLVIAIDQIHILRNQPKNKVEHYL